MKITGNPELDFFEQNPHLKDISEFKVLIRSKGKKNASKVMWAIYKTEDPESPLYIMPKDLRREEVAKNYLKDPDFDWSTLDGVIETYKKLAMKKISLLFKIWIDKLEGMTYYLEGLDYSTDDDKILKIFEKAEKIWSAYEKIEQKMIKEENKSSVFGGGEESSREKRQRK